MQMHLDQTQIFWHTSFSNFLCVKMSAFWRRNKTTQFMINQWRDTPTRWISFFAWKTTGKVTQHHRWLLIDYLLDPLLDVLCRIVFWCILCIIYMIECILCVYRYHIYIYIHAIKYIYTHYIFFIYIIQFNTHYYTLYEYAIHNIFAVYIYMVPPWNLPFWHIHQMAGSKGGYLTYTLRVLWYIYIYSNSVVSMLLRLIELNFNDSILGIMHSECILCILWRMRSECILC